MEEKAITPHNRFVSLNEEAISAGRNVPKVCIPITFLKIMVTIAPSGINRITRKRLIYVYAIGKYDAKGVEALINKRFRKSNVWLNYSLALNNYHFGELIPSAFPNNLDIRHAATLGGSYKIKNFEVSSGFNFRTGRPCTKPLQNNQGITAEIDYEDPNSSRVDNFIRLDLSAKYKFHIKKMKGQFGTSLWNVLNRKNVINTYYLRNVNNFIEINQYTLTITPNVNLRLFFK